jgi:D-alanine transaminase
MSRVVYLNGAFVPIADANVSVLDRGYLFADAVYEVWAVRDQRLLDMEGHLTRLWRSLGELDIQRPMAENSLKVVLEELRRQNRLRDGLIYLQIGRGQAWPRDHVFPGDGTRPSIVAFCSHQNLTVLEAKAASGVSAISQPDIRWGRCDIKTVGLLPNVLGKQAARDAGAAEVVFVDDAGLVTEGGSTNIWIIDKHGSLRTRSEEANILRGITRANLLDVAASHQLKIAFEAFSIDDMKDAREAFMTSASAFVTPIVRIDGHSVGDGKPGAVSLSLRAAYLAHAKTISLKD